MEKRLAKEMCINFKSEEISTTGEDCSKSNSKEKEVRSFALLVAKRFGKRCIDCFIFVFVLRVIVFHVIIYVAILCMNYPRYGAEIVHFQQVL